MQLKGWVELGGRTLAALELRSLLETGGEQLLFKLGGEFCLRWRDCIARDRYGVMPCEVPPGAVVCGGLRRGEVRPDPPPMPLEEAIQTAVRLRRDGGMVALSGGVDSALIAAMAELPAIAVGMEGCPDHAAAVEVAKRLGIELEVVTIVEREVEDAIPPILRAIPSCTPLEAGIAATLFFVARGAAQSGCGRVLTGQGADELFGGYRRYLHTPALEEDLRKDFAALGMQVSRDQAIAGLFDAWFSLPYLDARVVGAAQAIPAQERIVHGIRKFPLRQIAQCYLGRELAFREKKAMQYGSGIWKCIRKIARRAGYRDVGAYLDAVRGCT